MTISQSKSNTENRRPYRLKVTPMGWVFSIGGIITLLAFYLGFGLLPIWTEMFSESPDYSYEIIQATVIFFLMLSFVFAPATYAFFLVLIVGAVNRKEPIAMKLTESEVHFRYPFGAWQSRPLGELRSIFLRPVPTMTPELKNHPLRKDVVLQFSDGQKLEIGLDRSRQFSMTPPKLHAKLSSFYPSIKTEPAQLNPEDAIRQGEPTRLQIPGMTFLNNFMATLFFIICMLCVIVIPLWLLRDGEISAGLAYTFMGLFGLVFLGMAALTFSSMFLPSQPYKLRLHDDAVRFRYLFGRWKSWPAHELRSIALKPAQKKVWERSITGRTRYPAKVITVHHLVMTFSGGHTLTITEERAKQFDFSPQELLALFQYRYGIKD